MLSTRQPFETPDLRLYPDIYPVHGMGTEMTQFLNTSSCSGSAATQKTLLLLEIRYCLHFKDDVSISQLLCLPNPA